MPTDNFKKVERKIVLKPLNKLKVDKKKTQGKCQNVHQ